MKKEAKLVDASLIYYDCERIIEDILDKGEDIPPVYEWLGQKPYIKYALQVENRDFISRNGTPNSTLLSTRTQRIIEPVQLFSSFASSETTNQLEWLRSLYVMVPTDRQNVKVSNKLPDYQDSYIMLDNGLLAKISESRDMHPSYYSQPTSTLTDEDKHKQERAVYATMFSKNSKSLKKKGLRQTYFQGYNHPETFHMNNYGEMEPVEDHWRTLYWNPDITTDSTGTATISVWNSTSCRTLYLSAEGITPEGIPIIDK